MLIAWSRKEVPREACGILTETELRLMDNDAPLPEQSFVCKGLGRTVLHNPDGFVTSRLPGYAIWHSHPTSRAVPTPPDLDLMRETLVPMVIVSLLPTVPEIAVYKLDEHNATRAICVRTYRLS